MPAFILVSYEHAWYQQKPEEGVRLMLLAVQRLQTVVSHDTGNQA